MNSQCKAARVAVPTSTCTSGILKASIGLAEVRAVEFLKQNKETGATELVFRASLSSASTMEMRKRCASGV